MTTLRIWHSNNPNYSAKWYFFSLKGVASGSCSAKMIPTLVALALALNYGDNGE